MAFDPGPTLTPLSGIEWMKTSYPSEWKKLETLYRSHQLAYANGDLHPGTHFSLPLLPGQSTQLVWPW